jgi:hypothetical protein
MCWDIRADTKEKADEIVAIIEKECKVIKVKNRINNVICYGYPRDSYPWDDGEFRVYSKICHLGIFLDGWGNPCKKY